MMTGANLDRSDRSAQVGASKSGSAPGVVLATLCLVYALNFLDRQLLSVLAEPIKRDLRLTDTELGLLNGLAFALFYTLFGLPVAWLADRGNRVRVVSGACAIWSFFTICCGFSGGFLSLALSRVGVGCGEAGGTPPSYSIISDYFPPNKRALAFAIYSLGIPLGLMIGAATGAMLAAWLGWRAAFICVGAVGLVVAPIVPLLVKEPLRGSLDPVAAANEQVPDTSVMALVRRFSGTSSLLLTAVSTALCAFVGYAILSWSPAYLIRHLGMSLNDVAVYYSVVLGFSVALGTWMSGWLASRFVHRGAKAYALVPAASFLLATIFLIGFAHAPNWPVALALFAALTVLTSTYLPPAITVVQNAMPAAQRAMAGALLLFLVNLVGLGGGPLFVGALSDYLATHGVANSLGWALTGLVPICLLACTSFWRAASALAREARASTDRSAGSACTTMNVARPVPGDTDSEGWRVQ